MGRKKSKDKSRKLKHSQEANFAPQQIARAADNGAAKSNDRPGFLKTEAGDLGAAIAAAVVAAVAQKVAGSVAKSIAKTANSAAESDIARSTQQNSTLDTDDSSNDFTAIIQTVLEELKPILLKLLDSLKDALVNFDLTEAIKGAKTAAGQSKEAVENAIANASNSTTH